MSGWHVGGVVHDRWEVFGHAEGGMGRVWFVRDRAWEGLELAVKTLRVTTTEREAAERAARLFLRESQVWLDLGGHPNIVSGFYTIELDEALRFFMEYVPGENLAQRRHRLGRLALPDVLDLGIQLAAGMEYVHARRMVHRDLKPANCLVMDDGALRITDFGLSKVARSDDDAAVPPTAGVSDDVRGDMSIASAGTPGYMPPEQWRSLGDAEAPADVYAIGATLYELLAGEPPFGDTSAAWARYRDRVPANLRVLVDAPSPLPMLVVRRFHELVAPLPVAALGIAVPPELDAILAACLAKAPEERPTAGQLRIALAACHGRHVGPYARELPSSLAPTPTGENNRAVSYFVMGEPGKARGILDDVLAREPTALFPWLNRASLAVAAGDLEPTHAIEQLERVVLPAHPGMDVDRDVAAFRASFAGVFLAHGAPVISVGANAGALVTLTAESEVATWDAASNMRRLGTFPGGAGVAWVGGGTVAVAADKAITLLGGDGGVLRTIAAPDPLTSFAARPDGALLAAGDGDGGVLVAWIDRQVRLGGKGLLRAVAVCPSTDHVAAGSPEGGFAVWNAARRERLLVDATGCLACHVNGAWGVALAGGVDGVIRIWQLGGGPPATLVGHERAVTGLAFARDGTLVSASADGTVRAWDVRTHRQVRVWRVHHAPIRSLCLDRVRGGGELAVTGGDDRAVRRTALVDPPRSERRPRLVVRRDLSALERRRVLDERDRLVARIASGDATALRAAAELRRRVPELARDDRLREAEYAGGAALGVPLGIAGAYTRWSRQLPWPAVRIAMHPTGGGLAVAGDLGDDSELMLWDEQGNARASVRLPRILGMAWARPGDALYVACIDAYVRRLTAPALALAWTGEWAGTGAVRAVVAGRSLVGAGWSRSLLRTSLQATGALRTWDEVDLAFAAAAAATAAGRPPPPVRTTSTELDRRGEDVHVLAATHDGERVIAGRERGRFACWTLAERRREGADVETGGELVGIAAARDDRRIVTACSDGRWSTWRLPLDGQAVATGRHAGGVTGVAYLGNRFIATFGGDGATRLWDAGRGAEVGAFLGHTGALVGAVHPNDRAIATAGSDRMLHMWSLDVAWQLGAPLLADAIAAVAATDTPAWAVPASRSPPALADHALDVLRDVAAAPALVAGWPSQHATLVGLVGNLLAECAAADREGTIARVARSPCGAMFLPRL